MSTSLGHVAFSAVYLVEIAVSRRSCTPLKKSVFVCFVGVAWWVFLLDFCAVKLLAVHAAGIYQCISSSPRWAPKCTVLLVLVMLYEIRLGGSRLEMNIKTS